VADRFRRQPRLRSQPPYHRTDRVWPHRPYSPDTLSLARTNRVGGEGRRRETYAYHAGFKALAEHLARTNTPARVAAVDGVPFYRIRYSVPTPAPLVSIIIPTRDRGDVLKTCVESILAKTTYPNYQLVIVNNESRDLDSITYLDELRHRSAVRVLTIRFRSTIPPCITRR
jgi:hypothetical protein